MAVTRKARPLSSPFLLFGILAVVALGGYQLYVNLVGSGDSEKESGRVRAGDRAEAPDPGAASGAPSPASAASAASKPRLVLSSDRLELGEISSCGPRRTVDVVLSNDSERPLVVAGWASTCACVRVDAEPGIRIEPGSFRSVRLEVLPSESTRLGARVDFRVEGNAVGATLRLDFTNGGPLRPRGGVLVRRERPGPAPLDVDRYGPDGALVAEAFRIESVDPPVAEILPPLADGHGAIAVDFARIDALATEPGAERSEAFRFRTTRDGPRWESFEFLVRTDLAECRDLRVFVRNRR